VLVLTTSNITGAIDLAFVDRADLQLYVGPPSQQAIYEILNSCIMDLTAKQVQSIPYSVDLVPCFCEVENFDTFCRLLLMYRYLPPSCHPLVTCCLPLT
jgi:SpoVK/Ycf46/Vps4 family AAA+-type ATPase